MKFKHPLFEHEDLAMNQFPRMFKEGVDSVKVSLVEHTYNNISDHRYGFFYYIVSFT